jgi:hypothetical protein
MVKMGYFGLYSCAKVAQFLPVLPVPTRKFTTPAIKKPSLFYGILPLKRRDRLSLKKGGEFPNFLPMTFARFISKVPDISEPACGRQVAYST